MKVQNLREARTSLASFTKQVFATVSPGVEYKHNWHIDLISEYLEACQRSEIKRLIINMPPRNLKSISVNVAWPAWLLADNPSNKIMSASYSESLSMKHNVDTRLVVESDWYRSLFPHVRLAKDQNEKKKFQTTARGQRYAVSVGGTATGEGGNILIVDDPLNPLQATSTTEREKANTWFDQTFYTRLDDKEDGVVVVVMQRLHEQDLSGHLLDKGGWEHLCIPAIAEEKTFIHFGSVRKERDVGDVLNPKYESRSALEQTKTTLGSYGFAGQYQQSPVPADGGMVKLPWFGRYREAPQYRRIIQSWDTASKAKEHNDPSVCTTWGETDTGHILLDVWRGRLEYPELKRTVINQQIKWGADAILIEDKASGQALLQDLRRDTKLNLIAINPTADKQTRLATVSATIEAGRVSLPEQADWLADFEQELMMFPNGAHDDQVDSMSQYLNWIRENSAVSAPRVRSL